MRSFLRLAWKLSRTACQTHRRPIRSSPGRGDRRGPAERRGWCIGLRAPITVMHQARAVAAACDGHRERLDDQLGAEVVGHRPADDPAGVAVHHRREVQPALPRPDVGDIGRHRRLGSAGLRSRSTTSAAGRIPGTDTVLRPLRRRVIPDRPAWRISRSTRLRPTRTPSSILPGRPDGPAVRCPRKRGNSKS